MSGRRFKLVWMNPAALAAVVHRRADDGGFQRDGIPVHLDRIDAALDAGAILPPPIVFKHNGQVESIDGQHRIAALVRRGEGADVLMFDGTEEEARMLFLATNLTGERVKRGHALRVSPTEFAEKLRALAAETGASCEQVFAGVSGCLGGGAERGLPNAGHALLTMTPKVASKAAERLQIVKDVLAVWTKDERFRSDAGTSFQRLTDFPPAERESVVFSRRGSIWAVCRAALPMRALGSAQLQKKVAACAALPLWKRWARAGGQPTSTDMVNQIHRGVAATGGA